jgi:hypothetical protein
LRRMSRAWTTTLVDDDVSTFAGQADPERAPEMSRYVKGQFVFVGLGATERRRLHERRPQRDRSRPWEARNR